MNNEKDNIAKLNKKTMIVIISCGMILFVAGILFIIQSFLPNSTTNTDIDKDTNIVSNENKVNNQRIMNETPLETNSTPADTNNVSMNMVEVESIQELQNSRDKTITELYTKKIVRSGNEFYIDENRDLWGIGRSEYGQLGFLDTELGITNDPVFIAEDIIHVDFSGEYFVIFLTSDHKLYGMGGNPAGILNKDNKDDYNAIYVNAIMEPVLLMEDVQYAKCGYTSIIALKENGDVYVLGNNDFIQFHNTDYIEPTKVLESARYVTSYYHTYAALLEDDSLWTWGVNDLGQCGTEEISLLESEPQKVMDNVSYVWMGAISFNHSIGMNNISIKDNMIAMDKNGQFFGCGEGIGDNIEVAMYNDLVEPTTVKVSAKLIPITLYEYSEKLIQDIQLSWSENELKKYFTENKIDFSNEVIETGETVYSANRNTWELIFDKTGKLVIISDDEDDSMFLDKLKFGDSIDKVINYYGDDFIKYEIAENYYEIEYTMDDYYLRIGMYTDMGCGVFRKCLYRYEY